MSKTARHDGVSWINKAYLFLKIGKSAPMTVIGQDDISLTNGVYTTNILKFTYVQYLVFVSEK